MDIDFSSNEPINISFGSSITPQVDFEGGDVYGGIDSVKVNGNELPVINRSVDVPVPTKTSQLVNDSHYITNSDIPTIPTKTSQLQNDSGYITGNDLPTKTSQLTNDGANGTDPFATVSQLPTPITVDSEINDTSTNPVQNKTLYDAIIGKQIVFAVPATAWSEPSGTNPYKTVAIVTLPTDSFTDNCTIELTIADKFNDFAKYGFVLYSAEVSSQRIWITAMKKPTTQIYLTVKVYTYGN